MKRIFKSFFITLTVYSVTGCSSEPSSSEKVIDKSQNSPAVTEEAQKPTVASLTVGAFLRGAAPDEAAAKAFQQGMELAVEANSPPSMKLTFLDRLQGAPDSPELKSILTSSPLVVFWQTSDLAPSLPILKQAEVVAVPVWNVTKKVASFGNKVFGFGYGTEKSFGEYAKFAGNKLKSYRFAVFSSSAEPFTTQSKAFIEETKSQGNTIVFEEKVESANADFKSLIARATSEKCDTIFAVLPGDAIVSFIKNARAASFKGKILVGDSFYSGELKLLGKDADGIYLLQAWNDEPNFKAKYTAKHGAEPDGISLGAAALGYDLIQCIQSVGPNPNAESIAHSWLSNPCVGLTGKTQFSGERIAQRQKRILTVKGDKFELAS